MKAQLKDGVGLMTCGLLHVHEVVDIVRVEHKRLLADDIATKTQTIADKGIVGLVGRAYGEPLEGLVGVLLFGTETVELFLFGEK